MVFKDVYNRLCVVYSVLFLALLLLYSLQINYDKFSASQIKHLINCALHLTTPWIILRCFKPLLFVVRVGILNLAYILRSSTLLGSLQYCYLALQRSSLIPVIII